MNIVALNKRSWKHERAGGAEQNLSQTLRRVAKKENVNVELITVSSPKDDDFDSDGDVKIRQIGSDFGARPPIDTIISHIVVNFYLYYYLLNNDVDIIYYSQSPLPWIVATFQQPVPLYHHVGLKMAFKTRPFPINLLLYLIQRFGIWIDKGRKTVAVSDSTKTELVDHGHQPEEIIVIKNGVNLDSHSQSENHEVPTILYIGDLKRMKGADRLPKVHRGAESILGGKIRFEIAGKRDQEYKNIRSYADRNEQVEYHGYVSHERKLELLSKSWLLVVPSRVEGWGIAVIEANASGTPAVGMRVSGLQDSIRDGETGILVPDGDTDQFSKAVAKILGRDEYRETLEINAIEWAQSHSWEKSSASLFNFFQRVDANQHIIKNE